MSYFNTEKDITYSYIAEEFVLAYAIPIIPYLSMLILNTVTSCKILSVYDV